MKLAARFISSTRYIFTKLLTVSKISIKIKIMLPQALFVIQLTSAVLCKQRFLHRKKFVQYSPIPFQKALIKFYRVHEKENICTTFKDRKIFSFRILLMFNSHNFCLILTKVAKLNFSGSTSKCLKTGIKLYLHNQPVRNNGPLNV